MTRHDGHAAIAAVRTFLGGYLRYSYGTATADRIGAATRRLVDALATAPPRVSAAIAKADPRVTRVHAVATNGDHEVTVVAVVDDGQRRYEVPLEVRRIGGRWVVTDIAG